jgi:hypothetical protein
VKKEGRKERVNKRKIVKGKWRKLLNEVSVYAMFTLRKPA